MTLLQLIKFMNKSSKLLFPLILVVVIITTGCGLQPNTTTTPINEVTEEKPNVETQSIKLTGQEDKTAMEILKASHKIGTKSFGEIGEFIEEIDGVKSDTKHFWAFYINGESSNVGAGQYETKNSDLIEFKLEEIK